MDINKVWLSGLCVSQPIITKPSNGKTPLASFSFQVNEQYTDGQGVPTVRPNILRVEGLGRAAVAIMEKVQQGLRYYIDGYIRQDIRDDGEFLKIRTFSVSKEDTGDGAVYVQALRQAIEVIERSRDINAAVSTLKDMVSNR
jgi:single-stranded DNA-binding protein